MNENSRVRLPPEPTDFGDTLYPSALVLLTNACNLRCAHCFVYREHTPNDPRDKMSNAEMLRQLRILRDKHQIRSMLFMGGEPMIRRHLLIEAMNLFESSAVVTNGTYGIPSVPGHLVTVSLDGPREANDAIRGDGVYESVKRSIFSRDPSDGTQVIVQMAVTRQNSSTIETFVEEVKDWPVNGIAFTFYVPAVNEHGGQAWDDLRERDAVVHRLIALKKRYPIIKCNIGALELMLSDRCLNTTGHKGEHCRLRRMLPLYVGDGGQFERTFCCYGNDVDCSRCGAYAVFNSAWQHRV